MCGRACCSLAPDVIQKTMGVSGGRWRDKDKYEPGYNISPGSCLPVVFCVAVGGKDQNTTREMASMKWGLIPFWSKAGDLRRYKTSNARAETLMDKRSYKDLVPNRRCVVVVEGFFEWHSSSPSPGVLVKQPYYFQRPDRKLLTLAGLYDCWKDAQGNEVWTFTMITTAAAPNITWCHDRMPVILDEASIDVWLHTGAHSTAEALALLKPDPGLAWYPVSSLVNYIKNNSPECIQHLEMRKAKRGSPSSSPQRPGSQPRSQPSSPAVAAGKQPRIDNFMLAKLEPSSPSSSSSSFSSFSSLSSFSSSSPSSSPSSSLSPASSPSLPPPVSPYRGSKLEPSSPLQPGRRLFVAQRTAASGPSSSSSSSSASSLSSSFAARLSSFSSSSPLRPTTAHAAEPAATKRKRDDEPEEKAREAVERSNKTSCVTSTQLPSSGAAHGTSHADEDDAKEKVEEEEEEEQTLYHEPPSSVANINSKAKDDEKGKEQEEEEDDGSGHVVTKGSEPEDDDGTTTRQPWDEDSFPYYLVDDPTLSSPACSSSSSSSPWPSSGASCSQANQEEEAACM